MQGAYLFWKKIKNTLSQITLCKYLFSVLNPKIYTYTVHDFIRRLLEKIHMCYIKNTL